MRIGIASHVVLDSIKGADGTVTESLGGPPCYCGLTSRRFGFEVALATRIGKDMPVEFLRILDQNKITILQSQVLPDRPTTRFTITAEGHMRNMVLQSKCAPVTSEEIRNMKVDCWLASPVADEVPADVLGSIKQNGGGRNFVMLDPQGYMRRVDQNGVVLLRERLELELSGIRAIKVDQEEMAALTGGLGGLEGMLALQSKGVEFVVSTSHEEIHLLHGKTQYRIKMRQLDARDSTGAGDILSAAFCCAYMKERDPLWALCFGAGAVRAALETGQAGLAKIPSMSRIEESASYFYN
ncbi:MAG: PfkB family carbohydrate kinase, partial [Nitrososphaera sp.]